MPVYRYDSTTGKIIKSRRPTGRWKWRYNFKIDGQRYTGICHGARTKEQAEEIHDAMKRRVALGTYGKPDGAITFEEYARGPYLRWAKQDKETWHWDELQIEIVCQYFGKKALTEVTRADIKDYMLRRREEITERGDQRAKSSVNRERAMICKIFNLAIEDGYIERGKNPCEGTRFKGKGTKGRRMRTLSHDEQRVLFSALTGPDAWLLPIVRVDLGTAMRRGELLEFKFEHVDFDNDLIHLPPEITKTDKERTIPMRDDVRAVLIEMGGPGARGKVFNVKPNRVSQRFSTICKRLGLSGLVFHCLRHTAITRWAESGVSPFAIQLIAGHSSLGQTNHYAHVSLAELRKAVKMGEPGTGEGHIVQAENNDRLNMDSKSMTNSSLQELSQNA